MTCIVVDDEPLAREAIELMIADTRELSLLKVFNSGNSAAAFVAGNEVDLIFLDIQMPGTTGLELARKLPKNTLVIFTTAFAQYAWEGFELDAIDYLVKPVEVSRFKKAVAKAIAYHQLLQASHAVNKIESIGDQYVFVRSDRKFVKVYFNDILFIEGLKDYVILHTDEQKIITNMNIRTIYEQLPEAVFVRVSKSYLINVTQVASFDNNMIYIRSQEIPIGSAYRNHFFDEYVTKKLLRK